MLRYLYIIICIQACICSVYVDNNIDYEALDRRVRSKTTRLNKKQTKRPRNSGLVQFDVQNFMRPRQTDGDNLDSYRYYTYNNKKRENRFPSANDAGFVETPENKNERSSVLDYSNINDHAVLSLEHTRSNPRNYVSPRYFNIHSATEGDSTNVKFSHDLKKSTNSYKHNKLAPDKPALDPEGKCSFRNMKIPFFSRSKTTPKTKVKRHKIKRLFCFNVKKTTPTTTSQVDDDFKIVDSNFHHKDKSNFEVFKVRKRSYGPLCPKCIRELLANFKKKTTIEKPKQTTEKITNVPSKNTNTNHKMNLIDNLQDGVYNIGSERIKRNEGEEQDRERRLKELEEVEKKIENVHVAAPNFSRGFLNN